jgi:hypothetical protein
MLLDAEGICLQRASIIGGLSRLGPALLFGAVGVFGTALMEEAEALGKTFVRACEAEPGAVSELKKEPGVQRRFWRYCGRLLGGDGWRGARAGARGRLFGGYDSGTAAGDCGHGDV